MSGELVDLVDEDDHVIGVVSRAEMRSKRLRHRAVSIAVFRGDGRLLVHRRSDTKDVWPGMWDIAAGGVVGAGEGYRDAAGRELAEELGIDAVDLVDIGGGTFADESVRSICRCFRVVYDGPISFPDGEIAEARWVTRAQLAEMLTTHRFVPDSLALLLPLLDNSP